MSISIILIFLGTCVGYLITVVNRSISGRVIMAVGATIIFLYYMAHHKRMHSHKKHEF
jgi:hypothetical protein